MADELKALHRGRGIRRPDVRRWLGPGLLGAIGADPDLTEAELRTALAQLLAERTERLPRDLCRLFRAACGLSLDRPTLEERLHVVERQLDRSTRVLRRHLRQAEDLIAESLERAAPADVFGHDGWQWLAHDVTLVLREQAVATYERTLIALSDHQKYIHEAFTVPGLQNGQMEFEAISGLRIVTVERSKQHTWMVGMELPDTLRQGESLETVFRITITPACALRPFMVLAPVRRTPAVTISVDFGDPPLGPSWRVEDFVPYGGEPVAVPASASWVPVRRETFVLPRPGLVYGIAWKWPP